MGQKRDYLINILVDWMVSHRLDREGSHIHTHLRFMDSQWHLMECRLRTQQEASSREHRDKLVDRDQDKHALFSAIPHHHYLEVLKSAHLHHVDSAGRFTPVGFTNGVCRLCRPDTDGHREDEYCQMTSDLQAGGCLPSFLGMMPDLRPAAATAAKMVLFSGMLIFRTNLDPIF
jgi:hypothetical protein